MLFSVHMFAWFVLRAKTREIWPAYVSKVPVACALSKPSGSSEWSKNNLMVDVILFVWRRECPLGELSDESVCKMWNETGAVCHWCCWVKLESDAVWSLFVQLARRVLRGVPVMLAGGEVGQPARHGGAAGLPAYQAVPCSPPVIRAVCLTVNETDFICLHVLVWCDSPINAQIVSY